MRDHVGQRMNFYHHIDQQNRISREKADLMCVPCESPVFLNPDLSCSNHLHKTSKDKEHILKTHKAMLSLIN